MLKAILVFLGAIAITAILTPICIKIAPKIGAMDIPKDSRRMHNKPMPRFGGIAIFCGAMLVFCVLHPLNTQYIGVAIGTSMVLVLGIVDDLKNIPPKVKLAGQIVCALVIWFFSIRFSGMANFFPIGPEYIVFPTVVSIIVTVCWIIGITNALNLIDGLDGLAGGISFISCLSIAYSAYYTERFETCIIILSIAGACLGFLIFNFHPAKIFMGDGGSMVLGFLLASVSLCGDTPSKSITLFSVMIPLIILAVPVFDTVFAILRRVINHKPIMQADRGHIHHRMMAKGYGQKRTVIGLYCVSAIMGMSGILWTMKLKFEALILIAIVAMLLYVFIGKSDKEQ